MTPATIIREAQKEGVRLALYPAGTIKATGDGAAVNRWLAVIREHKAEIIDALKVGASDTATASRRWLIHFLGRNPLTVAFSPAVIHAEVLGSYPDARAAEPAAEIRRQRDTLLTSKQETAVGAWLVQIGESDETIIDDVLTLCRQDGDARAYYLGRAGADSAETLGGGGSCGMVVDRAIWRACGPLSGHPAELSGAIQ